MYLACPAPAPPPSSSLASTSLASSSRGPPLRCCRRRCPGCCSSAAPPLPPAPPIGLYSHRLRPATCRLPLADCLSHSSLASSSRGRPRRPCRRRCPGCRLSTGRHFCGRRASLGDVWRVGVARVVGVLFLQHPGAGGGVRLWRRDGGSVHIGCSGCPIADVVAARREARSLYGLRRWAR